MSFVTTRFVNDFQQLRQSLESAKTSAGTAESSFKGIEGKSADLRRAASYIDTYEARNDNESKDVSGTGKAALKELNGIARGQEALEDLHRTEEGARVTSSNELAEASGLAQGLNVEPHDKTTLLNAIGNAQRHNGSGNFDYGNVDSTIFQASLDLPEAINRATDISQDSDGQDKSLSGTYLEQRADKLEASYGQASSSADRAESYQDRVGGEVERALTELTRIENKRTFELVMGGSPVVTEGQLFAQQLGHLGISTLSSFSEAKSAVVSQILSDNDNGRYNIYNMVLDPRR